MVICLGCPLPNTSSGTNPKGVHNSPVKAPGPCFALLPTGVYQARTSRYDRCALTAPLHPCPQCPGGHPLAVCFCGTFLAIARTGRYPAVLPSRKPGLSSEKKTFSATITPPSLLAILAPPHGKSPGEIGPVPPDAGYYAKERSTLGNFAAIIRGNCRSLNPTGGDLSYRVPPTNGGWGAVSQEPFPVTTPLMAPSTAMV